MACCLFGSKPLHEPMLLIGPLQKYFCEIRIKTRFSFKTMHLKLSSAKWWPICLGLNVLTCFNIYFSAPVQQTSGGTDDGAPCTFPYLYNGEMYYECISTNHFQPWCGTTSNYDADKLWSNCLSEWLWLDSSMMTSSNGNIFRVTGPLCGEFTGPGEFPTQRPVTRSFDVLFDLRLNKRLSKQPWGWWFETPSWSLWRQRNARASGVYMHH